MKEESKRINDGEWRGERAWYDQMWSGIWKVEAGAEKLASINYDLIVSEISQLLNGKNYYNEMAQVDGMV